MVHSSQGTHNLKPHSDLTLRQSQSSYQARG